ncbi:MAG: AzlC family ABC transporter permease [Geminicoccaceae bacterium]
MSGVTRGARRLFPIAIFVIPFGIAFGVAAVEAGLSAFQAITMSGLVFSGAAQFAALDFWTSPIAFGSLALVALALNARHVIMGAALAPWVNELPLAKRLLVLTFLSDANFADSQPAFKSGERDVGVLLGGGLILWTNWIAGTAIGAAGGSLIGEPETFGVDVVMVCFFAAVVVGQLNDRTMILPAIVAAVVSIASLAWGPTGWNVILAAFSGGLAATIFHAK